MKVFARRDFPFDPPAVSAVVGEFDEYRACYWDLKIKDAIVSSSAVAEFQCYDNDGKELPPETVEVRMWRTDDQASGKTWVITRPGPGDHYYVTNEEAYEIFAANGYTVAELETFARRLPARA